MIVEWGALRTPGRCEAPLLARRGRTCRQNPGKCKTALLTNQLLGGEAPRVCVSQKPYDFTMINFCATITTSIGSSLRRTL